MTQHRGPAPHQRPSASRLVTRGVALVATLVSSLIAGPAAAATSPWYLGLVQSVGYESNLYRIADEQPLAPGLSRSDTLSTTSLIGGLDQTISRQRVYGSLNARANRFANNKGLDNTSYGLDLALDWETLERLSGTLRVAADQALNQFNNRNGIGGQVETQKNIANTNLMDAKFRLGRQTKLSFEAGLGLRQRRYSSANYKGAEFDEASASLGLRYRPSSLLDLGASIRQANVDYPFYRRTGVDSYQSDRLTRRYLDFSAHWEPSALNQLSVRVSPTRISHDSNTVGDFSGLTGSADWHLQASGKTQLTTSLSRDAGQSSNALSLGIFGPGVNDTSQLTTALRFKADHELTGKVSVSGSLAYARRRLTDVVVALPQLTLRTLDGTDNTATATLGARWAISRSGQLGCDVHNARRTSSNEQLLTPFNGYGFSCYGQLVLQ